LNSPTLFCLLGEDNMCRVDAVSQALMYLQQEKRQQDNKKERDKEEEQTFAELLEEAIDKEKKKDNESFPTDNKFHVKV